MLTPSERDRYDRQMMIPEIGEDGQEKLKRSRSSLEEPGPRVSDCDLSGGRGSGRIRMIDHDQVALSNLNRQILHWEEDVGRKKVDSARTKLSRLNSTVELEMMAETIAEDNVSRLWTALTPSLMPWTICRLAIS